MIRRLALAFSLLATLGILYLSFIGLGEDQPYAWVSDFAGTFVEPTGRYLKFHGYSQEEIDDQACLWWEPQALPELAIRTGGGKVGLRYLRHSDAWSPWRSQACSQLGGGGIRFQASKVRSCRCGWLFAIERDSDCTSYPTSSYLSFGHIDMIVVPWWLLVTVVVWSAFACFATGVAGATGRARNAPTT